MVEVVFGCELVRRFKPDPRVYENAVARGERWPAPLAPPPDVQDEELTQVARALIDSRTP